MMQMLRTEQRAGPRGMQGSARLRPVRPSLHPQVDWRAFGSRGATPDSRGLSCTLAAASGSELPRRRRRDFPLSNRRNVLLRAGDNFPTGCEELDDWSMPLPQCWLGALVGDARVDRALLSIGQCDGVQAILLVVCCH
jgi:hypothetical protein